MRNGTSLARRYELEREIGRGATGSVWVAVDTQLGRRVAVKLLDRTLAIGDESLIQEAKALAALRSPNVVQVYDVAFEEDQPFIVMELLEGESLEARLLRHPRLPLRIVAGIIAGIADGLSAIHSAGIVHRDVKPANVFLAKESGREVPKVLDFGVALLRRQEAEPGANAGSLMGTPAYMSPESLDGAPLDESADVWSLAVLSYEMLLGTRPFVARTLPELARQIRSESYMRPSAALQRQGIELDGLFRRAFAAVPSQRFHSASALSEELLRLSQSAAERVIRVLFLDDEVDMKLLLQRRFRRELSNGTYELHFATDGAAGLEELRQRPDMDVVLTDLNMPGMDGLTFLSHLPRVNPLVKAVVVTAYNDMANIRAAMNHGAFDFLCKPIDFDDLQRTIHKCADYVGQLRAAVDSREQNGIFRVLLGQAYADKMVVTLRASGQVQQRDLDATVAFVHVSDFAQALQSGSAEAFALLSAHFDILMPELLARHADVYRCHQDSVAAIFEGEDHPSRAADACLAIRQRLQRLDASHFPGSVRYGVAIGLDAGVLTAGLIGSLPLGRLEAAAVGLPVSAAAELQRVAQRHDILLSDSFAPRLAGRYRCQAQRRTLPLSAAEATVFQLEGLVR